MFHILDLKHGYHQMPLMKSSHYATAMSTPLGLMRWKVRPMGVKNRSTQFQRMTEDLLRDPDCPDPFADDMIIPSRTPEITDEEAD